MVLSPLKVAQFHLDRESAIAITFDDGTHNQAKIAAPLLDQFNFKGTFFLIPGLIREKISDPMLSGSEHSGWGGASWEEWMPIHKSGHEIANHSFSHKDLTKLQGDALRKEIEEGAKLIDRKTGKHPCSFAYPWNKRTPDVRSEVLKYHPYTREFHSIAFGAEGVTLETAKKTIRRGIRKKQLLVAMLHGIDEPNFSITSVEFSRFLWELKRQSKKIWVSTFGEIHRYQQLCERINLQTLEEKPNQLRFQVTYSELNSLPQFKPFTFPTLTLTPSLRRIKEVQIHFDNKPIQTAPKIHRNKIIFEAPKSDSTVTVSWQLGWF